MPTNQNCVSYVKGTDSWPYAKRVQECLSCLEERPKHDCSKSEMPGGCGHHCNHSWDQDYCHWCEKEFGEEEVASELKSGTG